MAGHVARVRARLALVAHRKVRGLLEGQYAATQTGRGIDFNDLRTYVRGDDVKDIDWKATARSREPLVRRYVTERRHTLWLVVATGRELAAAAPDRSPKVALALDVAGTLGVLAAGQGDRVGLVHGPHEQHHVLPARAGELHLERLLTAAEAGCLPESPPHDLVGLLDHAARSIRGRGLMLLVTGVPDERRSADMRALVRRLAAQHEVLAVTIGDLDPTAVDATERGSDLDSAHELPRWLAGDLQVREQLLSRTASDLAAYAEALTASGVVHAHVESADGVLPAVVALLERHRRARR